MRKKNPWLGKAPTNMFYSHFYSLSCLSEQERQSPFQFLLSLRKGVKLFFSVEKCEAYVRHFTTLIISLKGIKPQDIDLKAFRGSMYNFPCLKAAL